MLNNIFININVFNTKTMIVISLKKKKNFLFMEIVSNCFIFYGHFYDDYGTNFYKRHKFTYFSFLLENKKINRISPTISVHAKQHE